MTLSWSTTLSRSSYLGYYRGWEPPISHGLSSHLVAWNPRIFSSWQITNTTGKVISALDKTTHIGTAMLKSADSKYVPTSSRYRTVLLWMYRHREQIPHLQHFHSYFFLWVNLKTFFHWGVKINQRLSRSVAWEVLISATVVKIPRGKHAPSTSSAKHRSAKRTV